MLWAVLLLNQDTSQNFVRSLFLIRGHCCFCHCIFSFLFKGRWHFCPSYHPKGRQRESKAQWKSPGFLVQIPGDFGPVSYCLYSFVQWENNTLLINFHRRVLKSKEVMKLQIMLPYEWKLSFFCRFLFLRNTDTHRYMRKDVLMIQHGICY